MKKILFLTMTLTIFAFTTGEKTLKVEMTQAQWTHHFTKLQGIKSYIDKTNLPHQDVQFIEGTIDSLLMDLSKQLVPQIDTVKKK